MATYDVFLSYRRKDTASVQPLVDALRARGVSVWFDQSEIDEFAPITGKIRDGLSNSKALLAWYSADYPRSRPCQMELTAAFIAAQREGNPRQRVWVVNPENNAAHIQPIELRDEQHASAPQDSQQYEDLAGIVVQRLRSLTGLLGGIIPLVPPPQYGQRFVSARNFVGRVPDFWQLHSALSGVDTAIISGEPTSGLAQLSGMGGVGKSLLSEEYAVRFGACYPGGIFWLRALGNDASRAAPSTDEQLALQADQLRSFAVALGIVIRDISAEEIRAQLARKLGNQSLPFLWIVDDLASALDTRTVRSWLPPHPLGKTIFTTRSREYEEMCHSLSLGGLAPDEAVELLCSHRKPNSPEDEIAAKGIAWDLGYHPLALAVCSRALNFEAGLRSFVEFRIGLANPHADELELASEMEGVLPNGHEKSIAATLLRSVRTLGTEGQDFLRIAASLAAAPIPPSLIATTFSDVDGIGKSAGRRRAVLGFSQVESTSLAERRETDSRLVHVLVSRTMRFHDRNDERQMQLRAALIGVLNKSMPDVEDIRTHKRLELEVQHARELCMAGINDTDKATLGYWVARHDSVRGSYAQARRLQEQVINFRRRNLGEEHVDTLLSMASLGLTLEAQGELAGARKLQEQVLEVRLRLLGDEHSDTLASMNNLASTIESQGDLKGARKFLEQALDARCRTQGEDGIEGKDLTDTLASMNNLASILWKQGDLAGARKLQDQVLESSRLSLGEDHQNTLIATNNLAETLRAQDDLAGARNLQEQVLAVRRRILGEAHPDTLTSMTNLASTLLAQGDLVSACNLQQEALELARRILGEENLLTLIFMNNLAEILRAQGDLARARNLEEHLLEIRRNNLGEEHPDTLNSMHNLASTIWKEGDLASARKLEEHVLEIRRHNLGEEHPDTSTSEWNCLWMAMNMGDDERVLSLLEELKWLLQRDPEKLGATHQKIRQMFKDVLRNNVRIVN